FHDVIDMIQKMFYSRGTAGADKDSDHGHAEHSAGLSHFADCVVSLAAGDVGDKRPAVGMSDEHGLGGSCDSVQCGPVAAMRHVDRHAQLVHSLENLGAILGQADIVGLCGSSAEAVPAVGELRDPLAHGIETVHVVDRAEMRRVLLPDYDADFAR